MRIPRLFREGVPLEDKVIKCRDCGAEFLFTVGEQEFFSEKGFQHEPTRCRDCRTKRRQSMSESEGRQLHTVVCASCGVETQVPFKPRLERPVYCRECFERERAKV